MRNAAILIVLLVVGCSGPRSRDAGNCSKTVQRFFEWYDANYYAIDSIDLAGVPGNDTCYRIRFGEVLKYLSCLQRSGLFSDKFIHDKTLFFQQLDLNFVRIRQKDGPAEGLEADLLLLSQEAAEMLSARGKFIYVDTTDGDRPVILVKWQDELRVFRMDKASCKIDSIWLR